MTEKLFYSDPYLTEATARILKVEMEGGKARLLLDRTVFYPEGGGQPSDRGVIEGEGFRVHVADVKGKDDVWHVGTLEGRLPKEGEEVTLKLDWEWRYENMRAHTAQHILSAVLKDVHGAGTTGFQIFEDYSKIEIDYPGELDWGTVLDVEKRANEIVWGNLPVEVSVYDELPDGLRGRLRKELSDKVKPPIRIVSIPDVDIIPCGGTHVKRTGEIGLIKVLRFYRKTRKLWRVEFVAGNRALKAMDEVLSDYWRSLDEMAVKKRPLLQRVGELKEALAGVEAEKDALRKELWSWKARALLQEARELGGFRLITHVEGWPMKDAQAFAVHFVDKHPGTVLLLAGEGYAVFAKNAEVGGVSMVELLRAVLSEVGGGGGGSENLARGGGFRVPPRRVLEVAEEKLRTSE